MNKVLRGLRQFDLILGASETSFTDDYLLLILQFLNEAKEEIEESGWPWMALRSTVVVTGAASQVEYTIASASDADTDTNDRTTLLYETVTSNGSTEGFRMSDAALPMVFVTSDNPEYRMREVTQEKMERMHFQDDDEQDKPLYFAVYNNGTNLQMKVWPTPSAAFTVTMRLYIPADEIASTSIDTATLSIPSRPVYMKALWKANQERGSELGQKDSTLWEAYLDAHANAVAIEQSPADQTVFLER
jgi:hypothetical protein